MRARRVLISWELFRNILTPGFKPPYTVIRDGLPETAKALRVGFPIERIDGSVIEIIVEDESFKDLPPETSVIDIPPLNPVTSVSHPAREVASWECFKKVNGNGYDNGGYEAHKHHVYTGSDGDGPCIFCDAPYPGKR